MKAWHYMIIGAGAIIALFLSFRLGQEYPHKSPVEPLKEKVDTLFIRDTIKVAEPISVVKTRTERIVLPADTIRVHDTLMVVMEKEQIRWRDSLAEVYASGINPHIDSVIHFTQSSVITKDVAVPVKVHSRWGLGVSAGYGVALNGNAVSLSPYIGVGLHYNILSW